MAATALQDLQGAVNRALNNGGRSNADADAVLFRAIVVAMAVAGAGGLTGLLIVDGTTGSDTEGKRNSFSAYKTIGAALAVAQAQDYIWITPGTYTGALTMPAGINGLTLKGLGENSRSVLITSTSDSVATITQAGAAAITRGTFENLQIQNAGTAPGMTIGDTATAMYDNVIASGLVLRNVDVDKLLLVRLGNVEVYDSYITSSLDERNSNAQYVNCELTGYIMHYADATAGVLLPGISGRRGTYISNCQCFTSFALAGAVNCTIDEDTVLFCQLNASAMSPIVAVALDPWLRCAALIGNASGSGSNFLVNDGFTGINLGFANVAWQTATTAGAAGFDLSGCRCYGKAFVDFNFDLNAVVLDVKKYQFSCTNAYIADDLTVKQTPALAGAQRYFVSFRNCQLGTPGQVGVQAGNPTVQADRCDLDIRGSTRQNVVLSALNAGTIDRDWIVRNALTIPAAATAFVFGDASFPAEPPFPAGATIVVTGVNTTAAAALDDYLGVSAQSATGFTTTAKTAQKIQNLLIMRGPN